jgi:hypothetical protein
MLDPTTALAQVRAGLVKAYAVTAATRLSSAPESRRPMRRGCPAFACRCGMVFGCRRARRRISSPSSTLRPWQPWPMQACARVSPISDRRFSRATSRPPTHFAPCRRPRSRNGGQSSRRLASRQIRRPLLPRRPLSVTASAHERRSKYPPAKPGALLSEPLKAAGRGRCATPVTVASSRNNSSDSNSSRQIIDPPVKARPKYRAPAPCHRAFFVRRSRNSPPCAFRPSVASFSGGRPP